MHDTAEIGWDSADPLGAAGRNKLCSTCLRLKTSCPSDKARAHALSIIPSDEKPGIYTLAKIIAFIKSVKDDGGCNRLVAPWINTQTWAVAFRHQDHANAVFFDGHVEAL